MRRPRGWVAGMARWAVPRVPRAGVAAAVALAPAVWPARSLPLAAPGLPFLAQTAGRGLGSLLPDQCAPASSRVVRSTPWAQSLLDPGSVWALTRGAGQLVAVVASGVSAAVPALSGAVLPGRDMVTGGPGNTDCVGEGTVAAGIIAARHMPGAGFAGMAPAAHILPVNVVALSGNVASGAVAAGIRFAVASGATVVDVALSVPPGPSAALQAAVQYAEASNVVVVAPVASTGDFGTPANLVSYPAAYPGVIAVSAVDQAGAPLSAGSPRMRVDLAAPGAQVVSTGPRGRGDLIGAGAGVATAFVAAAAALVRSYHPQLTAGQVVHRLEVTADPPGTAVPSPAGWLRHHRPVRCGHGRAAGGMGRPRPGTGPVAAAPAARVRTGHLAANRRVDRAGCLGRTGDRRGHCHPGDTAWAPPRLARVGLALTPPGPLAGDWPCS